MLLTIYSLGHELSDDISVLVTHPDHLSTSSTQQTDDFLKKIVEQLESSGFLKERMSLGESKYTVY